MSDVLFKPKLLNRKRIKKMFKYIFDRPMFLLVASAGYGKSTSVWNFLSSKRNIEQIWFSLNANETDSIWVWEKLCSTIYKTYPNLAKKLSNYGLPHSNINIDHFIKAIKECITKPTVFVIDDFQEIKGNGINKFIENLVCADITNLHIIIISRTHPNFAYDELILKGYCYIMEQKHIAFTFEETIEFFELNGLKLNEDEKKVLFDYTDGWVAATYLAMVCYEKNNDFNNISNCYHLIKTAIYDKFDIKTKEVLMMLSPLNGFTLNQAVTITKNQKSISIIRELATNNCFIKYEPKSGIYTMHTMLKAVANKDFENSDIDINKIFHLSGEWYLENAQDIEAIEFFYKSKEFDTILNIIEKNPQYDLLNKAPCIMVKIFNDISIQKKLEHPLAYILFIQFYILNINKDKGEAMLYEAKRIYETNDIFTNTNQILAEIALIERLTKFYDILEMDKCLERAYKLFDGKTSKIYNSSAIFNFASPHNLSLFHTKKGGLYNIVETVESKFWKYNSITNDCAAGYEYLIRAEYSYETGDFETAELLAYKARFKSRTQNQLGLVCSATFTLMRLAILNGKKEDLDDYIKELQQHIPITGKTFLITELDIIMIYIYACIGQIEKISSYWLCSSKSYFNNPIKILENTHISYGKLIMLQKNFIELEKFSKIMLTIYEKQNNIFRIIISKIFASVAEYNIYGIEKAKIFMMEAIELAKSDNIIMPFAENSTDILPILYLMNDDYIKKILPVCEKFKSGVIKLSSGYSGELLTEREIKIMDLVAEGYKNIEIAEYFSIAPVTVEKTLSNIYKKLNVKNRIAAISTVKKL